IDRGASIPIRTFSPMIASTETSISSPIMMLWLDFRVRTSIVASVLYSKEPPRIPLGPPQAGNPFSAHSKGKPKPIGSLADPRMARRSLKPQLNQIRTWVRQGRTDAWIAHQLEVSVKDIDAFKREHGLAASDEVEAPPPDTYGPPVEEEPDLRAEDDALVAAALDAEPEEADDDSDSEVDGDSGESDNGDEA